jgi:hypothetical protein
MNKKIIAGAIIGAVIIGGGAFYGGMAYAKSSTPSRGEFASGQFMRGMGGTGTRVINGSGFTAGEIISKDDQSITVKLADGGSKIVFLTEKTPVTKNTSGSFADLSVGEQVVVTGSANQDGSVTAETIQLGGIPRMFTPSN